MLILFTFRKKEKKKHVMHYNSSIVLWQYMQSNSTQEVPEKGIPKGFLSIYQTNLVLTRLYTNFKHDNANKQWNV